MVRVVIQTRRTHACYIMLYIIIVLLGPSWKASQKRGANWLPSLAEYLADPSVCTLDPLVEQRC